MTDGPVGPVSASDLYRRLLGHFGPQGWWPGKSPFEIFLGAILTQSVNWANAGKAIRALRDETPLTEAGLRRIGEDRLRECIRPARFFRQKARRIFFVLERLEASEAGSLDRLLARGPVEARRRLLAIPGIGEETADVVTAYAGGYPRFVMDAYTRRIFARIGYAQGSDDTVRRAVEAELPMPIALQEFHALLTRLGHRICRPDPLCHACPLRAVCQYGRQATLGREGVARDGQSEAYRPYQEGAQEEAEDGPRPPEGGGRRDDRPRREAPEARLGWAHGTRVWTRGGAHGPLAQERDVTA